MKTKLSIFKTLRSITMTLALTAALAAMPAALSAQNYRLFLNNADGTLRNTNASGAVVTLTGASVTGAVGAWTLTLNNFSFLTTAPYALEVPGGTTIAISGTNRIESAFSGSGTSCGIYVAEANGTLTITGSGSLSAIGYEGNANYGIYTNGPLTFSGNVTVTAIGGLSSNSGPTASNYGINVVGNSIYVKDNANVTARGRETSGGRGMTFGGLQISDNGKITATGYTRSLFHTTAPSNNYVVPAGFLYWTNTTSADPGGAGSTGNGTTTAITSAHKYARIESPAAAGPPVIDLVNSAGVAYTSYTFPVQTAGYAASQGTGVIRVKNTGGSATGNISIALSGSGASAFSLPETTMNSVEAGDTSSDFFAVWYKTGLSAGTYTATATVTGASGGSATFNVSFTVNPAAGIPVITITTQPQSVTVTEGAITGNLTVAATVTQGATLSYQWYDGGDPLLSKPRLITGATAATFPIPTNLTARIRTYDYFCEVSATGGATAVESATAQVTVVNGGGTETFSISASPASPDFGTLQSPYTQPAAQTVTITNTGTGAVTLDALPTVANYTLTTLTSTNLAAGGTATFTIRPVAGLPAGTYNSTFNVTGSKDVSVAISPTFTVTAAATVNAQAPNITGQPAGATYTQNATATALSVTASVTDGGTLSYQWFSNTANNTTGGTTVGTNSATYTPVTTATGTYYYYVTVTNTNNSVSGTKTATATSNTAAVTVNSAAAVTYSVTVHSGTGSGDYEQGATVHITANAAPANHVFDCWTTASAGVIFDDANDEGTAFTMPANDVVVTATYRDVTGIVEIEETVETGELRAWVQDGVLHVSGLTAGQSWRVHTIMGTLLHQGIANANETTLPLSVRGIYVVTDGKATVKVVN